MKRDQRIAVRVTAEEKETLERLAVEHPKANSVSHLLRISGLGWAPVPLRHPEQPAKPQGPPNSIQAAGVCELGHDPPVQKLSQKNFVESAVRQARLIDAEVP